MTNNEEQEFMELVLEIDTREKSSSRIKAITNYFEENGGMVDIVKLDLCDYKITGNFRNTPVNVGIEYKTIIDFANSYKDLSRKLYDAHALYQDVGLFVEEGNFDIKVVDNGKGSGCDGWIQNFGMQKATGLDGIMRYSQYTNALTTFALCGVHVRTFNNVPFFPHQIFNLLLYVINPIQDGIFIKSPDHKRILMNIMGQLPNIGVQKIQKIIPYISNLSFACDMNHVEWMQVAGDFDGKKIYEILHDTSRQSECANNWELKYQEDSKPKPNSYTGQNMLPKQHERQGLGTNTQTPNKITVNKKISDKNIIKQDKIISNKKPKELQDQIYDFIKEPKTSSEIMEEFNKELGFSKEVIFKSFMGLVDMRKLTKYQGVEGTTFKR